MKSTSLGPKRLAILQLMTEDSAFEDRFFRTKKNPIWFSELKNRGYFEPRKNPKNQPADRDGYYIIPQWNVLEYLERVAEQTNIPENEQCITELLEIIKNVSIYKDGGGKIIDNYRTWWFFIKILIKLPNDKIPLEILDLVPIWLNSKYGGSLVDADVTTKLLPKFLHEEATSIDIEKAEHLISYITDFKWVEKRGVFNNEEEAQGVVENHWLEKFFIEDKGAKLVGKLCSKRIIYDLAVKLKTILAHRENCRINVDFEGKTYRLWVTTVKDFEYLCKIGTYEKTSKGGTEDFTDEVSINLDILFELDVKAENAETFSKALNEKIEKLDLPDDIKDKFTEDLANFYRCIFVDYSYIWFKNLIDFPNKWTHDFKQILLCILAESLYEHQGHKPEDASEIIGNFLTERFQYQTFRRLVIAFITKNWDSYKSVFWEKIFNDDDIPLLENPAYEKEVGQLFSNNASKFTNAEKENIFKVIELGPQKYIIEENREKYILYWKQRWYGTLKGDLFFLEKYEKIKNISTYDDQKEERDGEFSWVGPGPSPLTEEDILRVSNTELAKRIHLFKQRDLLGKGPSAEGFAKGLESAAQKQPAKFIDDLDPLLDTGYYYVVHILDGFRKAWESKVSFDWSKVLIFVLTYISNQKFWKNKLTVEAGFYDANYTWVIGSIGELIQSGSRYDEWGIPLDVVPDLKKIFKLISEHSVKEKEESRDFPSHVINCGWGKNIIGLLYFTLKLARVNKERNEKLWDEELKTIFETFLARNVYDAYTVLGENLISFAFLDKNWVENQLIEIQKNKDPILWEAFMSGYLAASRVNLDLYTIMKGNYKKSLAFNFKESILNERLVDHIGIGYLNGVETIDGNGLLNTLWNKWQTKHIRALISYFYSQARNLIEKPDQTELDSEMISRIIQFWRSVFGKLEAKKDLSQTDKEILSDIVKLSDYLPELDEESYKWLMLSAPYVNEDFNSAHFIESINNLKDGGDQLAKAKRIAEIYLEMMTAFYPDYDQKHIQEIVEFLYMTKDEEVKKLADKICDNYAKKGIEIVTSVYQKYNSK